MSNSRAFAYNPSETAPIGATQYVNLAIQSSGWNPTSGGLNWWNGPDEDLGYVIARSIPAGNHPTPVFSGQMSCSATYKGVDIALSNNNQTALQQFGYQMSVLTNTFINNNDKVMFSVLSTSAEPETLPQSRFIGVGKTTMNYEGSPYGGYPGNDTQSIGFNGIGDYYYNGGVVESGLPTWASGKGSIAFAGTDQYISTTVSSAPGTGSVTYEMWFYQTNNSPVTQGLLQTRTSTAGGDGIDVSISGGQIQITTSGAFLLTDGSVSINTWYHIAVVRNGTTAWTVYLDGTSIGTFNFANTTGTELSIGRKSATIYNEFFKGYITNFRYVKGVAVYTANFTPSTNSLASIQGSNINGSPSAAITGTQTQLLLNAFTNNFLKDSSSYNLTMSNPNGATSVTNSPFTGGDIIDIAISHGQGWFIRVNGGYWNNNPTADPITLSGYLPMNGQLNYYPALCPGYEGTMIIQNTSAYGTPNGYTLLGTNINAAVGFYRTNDFTDQSFLGLIYSKLGQSFPNGLSASAWLRTNGYWTSYVSPVLSLDAANYTSGAWVDSVGGKSFTLYNSPSWSSNNGGYFTFTASSSQYAECSTSLPSLPTFTTSVWHYWNGVNTGSLPCILTEVYTGGVINYFLGNLQGSVAQSGYFNGGFQTSPQFTLTQNTWYNIVTTCDSSQVVKVYLNNVLISTTSTTGSQPSSSNSGIRLMRRWDNMEFWGGYLAKVDIYDEALDSTKITSIWNSTKTRFGL